MSLIKVFYNQDLRAGHRILAQTVKAHKITVSRLEPGTYVAFVNKKQTGVKVYAANDVLAYMRGGPRGSITEDVIRELPRVFLGQPMGALAHPIEIRRRASGKRAA